MAIYLYTMMNLYIINIYGQIFIIMVNSSLYETVGATWEEIIFNNFCIYIYNSFNVFVHNGVPAGSSD